MFESGRNGHMGDSAEPLGIVSFIDDWTDRGLVIGLLCRFFGGVLPGYRGIGRETASYCA